MLTSSRYAGVSPKQVVPQLADEGLYLACESTMSWLQRRHGLRTRRRTTARTHVTTVRGAYLYLYLILDGWSRRVVGWHIAEHESADVAAALITRTCYQWNVDPRGVVLHSDNGHSFLLPPVL